MGAWEVLINNQLFKPQGPLLPGRNVLNEAWWLESVHVPSQVTVLPPANDLFFIERFVCHFNQYGLSQRNPCPGTPVLDSVVDSGGR